MGKILKPLLIVAAIAVNVIPGVGQVLSAGIITAITTAGITAAIGMASSALGMGPKSPATSPSTRNRLYASVDPATPRKFIVGETALATDIRYQEYGGASQEYLDQIVCMASHRITSSDEVWFDDKLAWSAGVAQGEYAGYLTIDVREEGNAGNTITINSGSKWGPNRRMTGLAYMRMRFKLTGNTKKSESPFAQSIPTRITIIGKGIPVYDPRFDSTRGGSGPMRADDQTTWAFTYGGRVSGRNPACQLLTYLLGWRINGKLAVGRGIPASRFDMDAFITAANACDEPVALASGGSEPRYRGDGIFSEADDPRQVIDSFEATMNGKLRDAGGRFALTVISNDLATPRFAFDDNDVLNNFQWTPTAEIDRTFNEVRGQYTSADRAALFQMVDYPRYRQVPVDGIERVQTLNLPLVQSPSQAQRLAKQQFARNLYQGRFEAQFGVRGWAVQLGDVVTLTFAALGWERRLFRVVEHGIRPDGICPMVLQEESADIYLWDADERPAVNPVVPIPYDRAKSILLQLLEAGQLTYADGTTLQAFATALSQRVTLAQADATTSLAQLAVIASDGFLSKNEKPDVIARYADIAAEESAYVTQADALAVDRSDYQAKRAALFNYLNGLSPAWNNTAFDTPINGAAFRTAFSNYYAARTALLNAMTAKVQSNAALAKTAADQAAAAAATANAQIAIIASDGYLSAGEKPDIIARYTDIVNEQKPLVDQADALGVDRTALQKAQGDLGTYLGTLSPPWNQTTSDTPINATAFRNAFANYYTARVNLITALTAKVQSNAAAAAAKADSAKADAAAAQAAVTVIASDGFLSRVEKKDLRVQVAAIRKEYDDNIATAASYPSQVSSASYVAVYGALNSYLNGLSPAWDDTSADTSINRTTFETRFADYYQTRQFLLNDIAYAASLWVNVIGDTRPENNATLGLNMIRGADSLLRVFATGGAFREVTGNASSANRERIRIRYQGQGFAYWEPLTNVLRVTPGDQLFMQCSALFSSGIMRCVARFYDTNGQGGNDAAAFDVPSNGSGSWRTIGGTPFTVPEGAAHVQVYTQWYNGGGDAYSADPVLQKVQPGADSTNAAIQNGAADTRIQGFTGPIAARTTVTEGKTQQLRESDGRALTTRVNSVYALKGATQVYIPTNGNTNVGGTVMAGVPGSPIWAYVSPGSGGQQSTIQIFDHKLIDDAGTLTFGGAIAYGFAMNTQYWVYEDTNGYTSGNPNYQFTTNAEQLNAPNRRMVGSVITPPANAPEASGYSGGGGGGGGIRERVYTNQRTALTYEP